MWTYCLYKDYGKLSQRNLDKTIESRVETDTKKNINDFILWKFTHEESYPSEHGWGRPGWHIECSALSSLYLGENFDIHGGGADLMFPHHENEIAQSKCAFPNSKHAKYWVHNGFLTVDNKKMSKSLNNFITTSDLTNKGIHPETIRLALLSTNYRNPLNWTDKLLNDAKITLDKWYKRLLTEQIDINYVPAYKVNIDELLDDMNVQKLIARMHAAPVEDLLTLGKLIGIFSVNPKDWKKNEYK